MTPGGSTGGTYAGEWSVSVSSVRAWPQPTTSDTESPPNNHKHTTRKAETPSQSVCAWRPVSRQQPGPPSLAQHAARSEGSNEFRHQHSHYSAAFDRSRSMSTPVNHSNTTHATDRRSPSTTWPFVGCKREGGERGHTPWRCSQGGLVPLRALRRCKFASPAVPSSFFQASTHTRALVSSYFSSSISSTQLRIQYAAFWTNQLHKQHMHDDDGHTHSATRPPLGGLDRQHDTAASSSSSS
jgi:hypothetical protein